MINNQQSMAVEAGAMACISAARAAGQRGERALAADLFAQAIDLHDRSGDALPTSTHHELGVLLYGLQRLEEAERRVRGGLDRHPRDPALMNLLGVILKTTSRPKEAMRWF